MPAFRKTVPFHARPLVLIVAAHPIWNVPPFVNAARELAGRGFSVIVVGYRNDALACRERIAPNAWIVRIPVTVRRIRWANLRKPLALFEFIFRVRSAVTKRRPSALIVFNDPASILQTCTGPSDAFLRVNWLLEYPELERYGLLESLVMRFSASCWARADIIVVPTRERLALHLALRPECGSRRTLIIQNAPSNSGSPNGPLSDRTEAALHYLNSCEPDTIRIIYSGAIGNRYGTDSLIKAAGSFARGIRVLLLGPKHPLAEREVGAAMQETSFPENIQWFDQVPYDELSSILKAGDVGFATYRGDTLNTRFAAPGKLYEYLKSSLVILSDTECCIYAEATAAQCGMFFSRPVTEQGIRDALGVLLNNRDRLPQMKSAARFLFKDRLCMEKQMAPLIDLFEEASCASAKNPRPRKPIRAPLLQARQSTSP